MLATLIGLNKIPKFSFMAAFATSLLSIVDPHTNSDPSLGLELSLGLDLGLALGVWVGLGLGVGSGQVLGSGLGLRIMLGCKVEKIFLRAPQSPSHPPPPIAPPRPPPPHTHTPGQRHGQQAVSGTADPGVVKQDKSSRGSIDTTKTRSNPQRVRMSNGERPIGTAKGKQPNNEALCQPSPPPRGP